MRRQRWLVWAGTVAVFIGGVVSGIQAVATGQGSGELVMLVGIAVLVLEAIDRMR